MTYLNTVEFSSVGGGSLKLRGFIVKCYALFRINSDSIAVKVYNELIITFRRRIIQSEDQVTLFISLMFWQNHPVRVLSYYILIHVPNNNNNKKKDDGRIRFVSFFFFFCTFMKIKIRRITAEVGETREKRNDFNKNKKFLLIKEPSSHSNTPSGYYYT